jgi:hypothetical protein
VSMRSWWSWCVQRRDGCHHKSSQTAALYRRDTLAAGLPVTMGSLIFFDGCPGFLVELF